MWSLTKQIVLNITLNKGRKANNVSYLLQDCRIFGRNIKQGMGSIEIKNKAMVVYLTNCAPDRLNIFLKSLDAKLTLMRETALKNLQNPSRTPMSSRSELLNGLPNVFNVLSPLSVTEIRELQKMRGQKQAQTPSKASAAARRPLQTLNGSNNALTPTSRSRKRPLSAVSSTDSAVGLSDEQKRVVHIILKEKQSIFFTGSAGTGKSLVLKKIIGSLPASTTFVTAATGVAACQIGGTTLHSFVGIGTGTASLANCVRVVEDKKGLVAQWKLCTHLVIDEISMVGAEYFTKMEAVARKIRGNDRPFGGIQLIITGDFLQLPPVVERGEEPKFCFQTPTWTRCVRRTVVLQKVHRQNDSRFIEILNQIRVGKCDDEATLDIQSTSKNYFDPDKGIVATKLCTHTKDADSVNRRNLELLDGRTRHFIAHDDTAIPDALNKSVPRDVTLKIGAQVMLTKNLDLSKGMSNGSRGIVSSFSKDGYPVVKFLDSRAPQAGVEVKPYPFSIRIAGGDGMAIRRQVPLMLAWAISIHKSQGLTLDAVEVCLDRVFADGQAYVALSRARSLSSLCVLGFESRNVTANEAVVQYYEDLTRDADEDNSENAWIALESFGMDSLQRYPQYVQKAVRPRHPFIIYVERRFRETDCYDLLLREKLNYAKALTKRPHSKKVRFAIDGEESGVGSGTEVVNNKRQKRSILVKRRKLENGAIDGESTDAEDMGSDESHSNRVEVPDLARLTFAVEPMEQGDSTSTVKPNRAILTASHSRSQNRSSEVFASSVASSSHQKFVQSVVTDEPRPLQIRQSTAFTVFRCHRDRRGNGQHNEDHLLKHLKHQVVARRIPPEEELTDYERRILILYRNYERLLAENNFMTDAYAHAIACNEHAGGSDEDDLSDIEYGG
ncbi:hypothetical protein QR680_001247 [Steinernema hermaphroditum]|uniref:ATP-dependent DNA helicase PIF1 n=1 Tax=Steinernema hermaphroditum TaxID=289476 RepID=A0AA39LF25_9BILA|nr:hypothetical protein QR680_001247 [Steinernema hermaphroditum]